MCLLLTTKMFQRAGDQPEDAPADGLTLKEVWDYGFELPALEESATYYFDQIMLKDLNMTWMPFVAKR